MGKPDVRNLRGGRWKRGLWWNCEPTSLPKGRGWKPSTYGCAHQRSTQRGVTACGTVDKFAASGQDEPTGRARSAKARATSQTPERCTEIARKAAAVRWESAQESPAG